MFVNVDFNTDTDTEEENLNKETAETISMFWTFSRYFSFFNIRFGRKTSTSESFEKFLFTYLAFCIN